MPEQDAVNIDTSNTSTEVVPGTIVNEKYKVLRPYAHGDGNAFVVLRLVPPRQGEMSILKILPDSAFGEDKDTTATRFQHEILAALSVKHSNVSRLEETVKCRHLLGYVSEYVEAKTLDQIIRESGVVPLEKTVLYLRQMCAGLDAIHRAGIVHRGLKPKNVLITPLDQVKITNFALAKLSDQKSLTKAGAVLGTVEYMAPEYVIEGIVDARLDIYALGVIAYQMVCGVLPLLSDDMMETFTRRASSLPPRPEELNSMCPAQIGDCILKALHYDKNLRYQSAIDFKRDLEKVPGATQVQPREVRNPPDRLELFALTVPELGKKAAQAEEEDPG